MFMVWHSMQLYVELFVVLIFAQSKKSSPGKVIPHSARPTSKSLCRHFHVFHFRSTQVRRVSERLRRRSLAVFLAISGTMFGTLFSLMTPALCMSSDLWVLMAIQWVGFISFYRKSFNECYNIASHIFWVGLYRLKSGIYQLVLP